MKMSRNALKAIIKECLIEILSEGLGNVQAPARVPISGMAEQRRPGQRQGREFDASLDTPRRGTRLPTAALKNAIKESSGGNPMLASMLADTAMTTLPDQLSHGDHVGSSQEGTSTSVSRSSAPIQQEQFSGNPDEMFGDGSARWADLAFSDPVKKLA